MGIETLNQVRQSIRECHECPLHLGRKNAVPGEGPVTAKLALLGEGPGWEEDKRARPFIGSAGKVLDEVLESIGIQRPQVYILNTVNCRTSATNRDPRMGELESCRHWIWDQLNELSSLKVVCALGRFASMELCPTEKPADMRGKARLANGLIYFFAYHPAAVLHNPNQRPELFRQFQLLKTLL